MTTTYEMELDRVVYAAVARPEYPNVPSVVSDADQKSELEGLLTERISRPATKEEYIARVIELTREIDEIASRNSVAAANYAAARQAVDDQYAAAIAAAKLDTTYIMAAVRAYRDYLLEKSDWTQLADAALSTEKKAAYAAYRGALRNLPQSYPDGLGFVWPTEPE